MTDTPKTLLGTEKRMRKFVTIAGSDSSARVCSESGEAKRVYVAEVVADAGVRSYDDENIECGAEDLDKVRDVVVDLHVPLFCCRAPERKLPERTAEEALRQSAAKGKEGLNVGDTVLLNGREITL